MPTPTTTVVNQRPDLAPMVEFDTKSAELQAIAYKAFPVVNVLEQADQYHAIPFEEWLRVPDDANAGLRGDDGEYERDDFGFEEKSYATNEYGIESTISDRRVKKYNELDLDVRAARRDQERIIRIAEARAAAKLFNASNFSGQTTSAGTAFTNLSSSDPEAKVREAMDAVEDRIGMRPNTVIMSDTNVRRIRANEKVRSVVSSQGAGQSEMAGRVGVEVLKEVFDVPHILVGGMSRNTAKRGAATQSVGKIWSNTFILVGYIDHDSGDIEAPSLTRCFHWTEDGSQIGGVFEEYREDPKRRKVLRTRHDVTEDIVFPEAGQLITGVE